MTPLYIYQITTLYNPRFLYYPRGRFRYEGTLTVLYSHRDIRENI